MAHRYDDAVGIDPALVTGASRVGTDTGDRRIGGPGAGSGAAERKQAQVPIVEAGVTITAIRIVVSAADDRCGLIRQALRKQVGRFLDLTHTGGAAAGFVFRCGEPQTEFRLHFLHHVGVVSVMPPPSKAEVV